MKLCMIGTGYVGLATGVGFSEQGHNISFIDLDSKNSMLRSVQINPTELCNRFSTLIRCFSMCASKCILLALINSSLIRIDSHLHEVDRKFLFVPE